MANTVHYWKLRELGVRANAAVFVGRILYQMGQMPTAKEYAEFATAAKNMSYTPLSYLPRAERNR